MNQKIGPKFRVIMNWQSTNFVFHTLTELCAVLKVLSSHDLAKARFLEFLLRAGIPKTAAEPEPCPCKTIFKTPVLCYVISSKFSASMTRTPAASPGQPGSCCSPENCGCSAAWKLGVSALPRLAKLPRAVLLWTVTFTMSLRLLVP